MRRLDSIKELQYTVGTASLFLYKYIKSVINKQLLEQNRIMNEVYDL